MTNDEAKFILQAYRPNGADAGDATFQAALAQAKQDAALGRWWESQQKFDREVARKLRAVEPPAELLSAILTGAVDSQAGVRSWWRQPKWLAMAASVLLVFSVGLSSLWSPRARAADDLPVFAVDYVVGGFFLSEHNSDVAALRAWLTKQHAPLPTELPAGFAQLRGLGCKTLDYRGKEVSLICFGTGKEYHLFVARREDFPLLPANTVPQYLVRKGHSSAAWSDEKNHYVVVTDDSLKALKECLGCERS